MKTLLIGTFLSLLSLASVIGQTNKPVEPAELVQKREELMRNLQRASIPIYEAYLKSLEPLRAQFTRDGKVDAVNALQVEIKRAQDELDKATRAAARGNTVSLAFTILSATYGSHEKHRTVETTEMLRRALREGKATLKLDNSLCEGGKDPAPFVPKATTVTYTIDGQRKQKTFKEGYELNFDTDLK
jgi:hypothetical protein